MIAMGVRKWQGFRLPHRQALNSAEFPVAEPGGELHQRWLGVQGASTW